MTTRAFHLHITPDDTRGATLALIPGDPGRVARIASFLEEPEEVAAYREYTTYRGKLRGRPVLVTSTGIGGPSTSICVEELAQLGVRTFLRIGTTGSIQQHVKKGDIIITQGAVRLDGASTHFAPVEYPAVSDFFTTAALVDAARAMKVTAHVGITASSDTFYPGQERYDTYSGHVASRFRGSMKEWQALGVLNYEMESATLFTMCQALGLKAGCVLGVIANRLASEEPDPMVIKDTEDRAIRTALKGAEILLNA